MTKLIGMPSNLKIDNLNADAFLYGIKDMSVNMPVYFKIEELESINKYAKENGKGLFIALNKNMHNKDLKKLEECLIKLSKFDLAGIFYYDVAVLSLVKKLNLDIPLVWSSEHLTTNYSTINFWQKYGISHVNVSAEITKEEILEIRKNTNVKMIVSVLGYLPMFVSERHLIDNYLEKFEIKDNSKKYFLEKSEELYPITDNKLGTNIYSSRILNAYNEYLEFIEHNVDYVLLNSFLIDNNTFEKVVDIFNSRKVTGEEEINKLLDNKVDKGFLYQETIYRVKK